MGRKERSKDRNQAEYSLYTNNTWGKETTTTSHNCTNKERKLLEIKLYTQHAVMGCLAPEFRHHQVGTVQGLLIIMILC